MSKTIVEINSNTTGSTGRIMLMTADVARNNGYTVYTSSPRNRSEKKFDSKYHIYIGNSVGRKVSVQMSKITGLDGSFSVIATLNFISKLKKIKPDLVHLHNLHFGFINIKKLFKYLKESKIPVVWTFHDCWPFTGHCPYFDFIECKKWMTQCENCQQLSRYPELYVDRTKRLQQQKTKWFSGIDMTIVTPSFWLSELVSKSFLKNYNIKVINNGIDLSIFQPMGNTFRKRYGIATKFIVLGVANVWGKRKGLDVFIRLSHDLNDEYQVVVVGVSEEQKGTMPENIIAITHTSNQQELAEIYSAADVFVNPTLEENFPTTNIEAIACGTGVITYRTGGSPEMLNENSGVVVDKNDYEGIIRVIGLKTHAPFDRNNCRHQSLLYSNFDKYKEYTYLYDEILSVDGTR